MPELNFSLDRHIFVALPTNWATALMKFMSVEVNSQGSAL
jgi:hypothetical protein